MNTRRAKENELPEIIDLVSSAFSYKDGVKINRDFPLLFAKENTSHLYIGEEVGEIVSHAGSLMATMRSDGLEVPVGGIGGVATKKGFEGKGYASALVSACCEDLAAQGAVLAFLWTGQYDFYRKLGFELVARQWIITADPAFAPALIQKSGGIASRLRYEEYKAQKRESFYPEAFAKLASYPLGIKRTFAQFQALLSSTGCRVFAAYEEKDLKAYMVMGKGHDLEGYIHEWAGDDRSLLALFAHILSTEQVETKLLTPQFTPEEVSWIYALDELGVPMQPGFMSMVKILNFPVLQSYIVKRVMAMGLDPNKLVLSRAADGYQVGWDNDIFTGISELQLLQILFGPEPPEHSTLGAILPLRLWWWGMDSV